VEEKTLQQVPRPGAQPHGWFATESFPSGQTVHIQQGIEIKRPSQIFALLFGAGEKIVNVRVGGNAVEVMEGDFSL